jgi:hypothetical protein
MKVTATMPTAVTPIPPMLTAFGSFQASFSTIGQ